MNPKDSLNSIGLNSKELIPTYNTHYSIQECIKIQISCSANYLLINKFIYFFLY